MKLKRLRLLALEVFRVINVMNPQYFKNLFTRDNKSKGRQNEHVISARKTVTYHDKSVGVWVLTFGIYFQTLSNLQYRLHNLKTH